MNAKVRMQNDELFCHKCGHSIDDHCSAGCAFMTEPQPRFVFCNCPVTAKDIAAQAVTEARREIAEKLNKIVQACDYCEGGFVEYQPEGIDGYLPTGDANFVIEPCPYCSEFREIISEITPAEQEPTS